MTDGTNSPARTNGLAIAALVTGILGFSILSVIFGHVSLNQINRTREDGRGLAIAGLVLGYVGLAGWALVCMAFIMLMTTSVGMSLL